MTREQKIFIIIVVNIAIVIAEVFFGLIANSYALIADALHNGGDALAVVITYIALVLGGKSATFKQTFGYMRAEMMAAFVNSLFLFITMFLVLYEAIHKLITPEMVDPIYMISIGLIALIANSISAYILNNLGVEHTHGGETCSHSHHDNLIETKNEDSNIKSAYLHMLGDALISLGVVVAGIFIYFFKIYSIDAVLAIIFSIYILKETFPILKKSFLSLMDINIINIDKKNIEDIVLDNSKVTSYHDLHIYKPSSKHDFISLHVVFDDKSLTLEETQIVTDSIYKKLKAKGFNHILIQTDLKSTVKNHANCKIEA